MWLLTCSLSLSPGSDEYMYEGLTCESPLSASLKKKKKTHTWTHSRTSHTNHTHMRNHQPALVKTHINIRQHSHIQADSPYPHPDSIRSLFWTKLRLSVRHHPFPAFCLSGSPSGSARPAPCLRSHNKAAVTPSLASPLGNSWNRGRGVKETKNPQGPVILHWSRHVFSSSPLIYHAVPASKRLIAFRTFVVCRRSGTFPASSSASLHPHINALYIHPQPAFCALTGSASKL